MKLTLAIQLCQLLCCKFEVLDRIVVRPIFAMKIFWTEPPSSEMPRISFTLRQGPSSFK